jgi:hypothetical protein
MIFKYFLKFFSLVCALANFNGWGILLNLSLFFWGCHHLNYSNNTCWKSTDDPGIIHCDHVNDFPVVNGTPGIIQDPIDLLLAKSNFTNKRWMVLVFSTCNTVDLLLVKLHFVNKRRMVLVFSTCNTVDLLF